MILNNKYIEYWYPYVVSWGMCLLFYIFRDELFVRDLSSKIFRHEFLSLIITIESVLFGFLLTILSLVIQMDNKAVKALKESNKFVDLIGFCKSTLSMSFLTVLVSLLLILFSQNLFLSIMWIFFFFSSMFTLFRFVRIFFVLAESSN